MTSSLGFICESNPGTDGAHHVSGNAKRVLMLKQIPLFLMPGSCHEMRQRNAVRYKRELMGRPFSYLSDQDNNLKKKKNSFI